MPSHGRREESDFRFRSKVHFSCSTGYMLFGSSERTCLPNGTWSGNQPFCKRKHIITRVCDSLAAKMVYFLFVLEIDFKVQTWADFSGMLATISIALIQPSEGNAKEKGINTLCFVELYPSNHIFRDIRTPSHLPHTELTFWTLHYAKNNITTY